MNNAKATTGIDASRVASKIWIGGFSPDTMAVHRAGFTTLVRVAKECSPCDYPLDDNTLTPEQAHLAEQAANAVSANLVAGHRVLITCAMGLNRSAFVAALAMMRHYRLDPHAVIATIRRERGHAMTLSNKSFVEYLVRARGARSAG